MRIELIPSLNSSVKRGTMFLNRKNSLQFAVLLGLSGISVVYLAAQGATATILGTVTDSTGAAIPEAAVQVKNVGTAVTQSTVSDGQGRFRVPDLSVGEYEVQA